LNNSLRELPHFRLLPREVSATRNDREHNGNFQEPPAATAAF
jgi:hypothetical protein